MTWKNPPRVLFVVEKLGCGSVETWLLRMAAHARKQSIPIDWSVYCALGQEGPKDGLARDLGIRVVYSPVAIKRKMAFARALRREVKTGKYDILHAQHDLVSGFYLAAAAGVSVGRRIVHVHNADEQVLTDHPIKKVVLRPLLRRTCLALADTVAANSNHSLDVFLAGRPRRPGKDVVHYLGIDPTPFEVAKVDRKALRRSLELPEDAPILLFAGRLVPEKNPVFTVDVLAELRRLVPHAIGVFVGSGSLEGSVRERASRLGLIDAVHVLGWRDDVANIMLASDWFILPHPEHPVETFGIAVVEAQLAGLRMLLSHGILNDPLLPTASYQRLSLAEPPNVWARAALDLLERPAPSRTEAMVALRQSPMDMDRSLTELMRLHA